MLWLPSIRRCKGWMRCMEVKTKHMILLNACETTEPSEVYMAAGGSFKQKGCSYSNVSD